MDVLAANPLRYALFADFASRPHRDRNFARFVFLDQAALSLYTEWERVAQDTVAALRLYAGRHTDDPQLTELIGELSLHSDTFRRLWADHDVRAHTTGIPVPTPNMRGTSVPPLQPDSDESPPVS
ncbi:hypothetical protein [Streptomyces sp. NBC_01565]|uniref:MmyB family transcriptional regulator n=1 Tax=Streptomyces sp. NBC_01565 TaxID=2975881 RepID=UPI002253FE73|nr:hypothetical protein [Streptomyces sp. NBC_01565]MCX4546016.1 hypothetical protein [Streptomyces sp. NBC_01565]